MYSEMFVKNIKNICSSLMFVLLIAVFLIIIPPIHWLRFCISKLNRFGPNLASILTKGSTPAASDDIYTDPTFTIIISAVVKWSSQSPDIVNYLGNRLTNKLIRPRSENGQLKYPELQQYPYQWLGFLFWKWDDHFDISNHVNYYSTEGINENSKISKKQLHKLENSLVVQPFVKNRSPWQIHVIRNVESENGELQSAVLFRFHHGIADGFGLLKLFFTSFLDPEAISTNKVISTSNIVKQKINIFKKTINLLKSTFYILWNTPAYWTEAHDTNEWTSSEKFCTRQFVSSALQNSKVCVADLKEIAKFYQVSVNSVIYAGMTAALRKSMLETIEKMPKIIHVTTAAPMPNHPDKLTNHWTPIFIELPVGDASSINRLHKVENVINELKTSPFPGVTFCIFQTLGGLFPWMIRLFLSGGFATGFSSNFPGPKQKVHIGNQEVVELYFLQGPQRGKIPVGFNVNTYGDGLYITASSRIHDSIEDVDTLINDMHEEFQALKEIMHTQSLKNK